MRSFRTPESARGSLGNSRPYLNKQKVNILCKMSLKKLIGFRSCYTLSSGCSLDVLWGSSQFLGEGMESGYERNSSFNIFLGHHFYAMVLELWLLAACNHRVSGDFALSFFESGFSNRYHPEIARPSDSVRCSEMVSGLSF